MAAVLKTIVKRSLGTVSYHPPPYQIIHCHSFHQSRVLAHHKPPRDPNQPYNPPWKPAPLFPPGTYKKTFEKIRGGTIIIIDSTTKIWSIYEKIMKVVGPTIATMAFMIFFKNKELEEERKKGNEELKNTVLETKKILDGAVEELRVAKMDAKENVEFKEKVVKELLKMEGVKIVDKIKVGEKIVENEVMAMMFLAASDVVKNEIVKMLLDEA